MSASSGPHLSTVPAGTGSVTSERRPSHRASSSLLQLPPVLEVEATLSSSSLPTGVEDAEPAEAREGGGWISPSCGFAKHHDNDLLTPKGAWPSDNEEQSASESTVTTASVATSITAGSSKSGKRVSEASLQASLHSGTGPRKSPRSAMMGSQLRQKSSASSGGRGGRPSSALNSNLSSRTLVAGSRDAPELRRAASAPPRPLSHQRPGSNLLGGSSMERTGSGSPPPTRTFKKQLSTAFEHATPPRASMQHQSTSTSTAVFVNSSGATRGKENRRPTTLAMSLTSPGRHSPRASPPMQARPSSRESSVHGAGSAVSTSSVPRLPGSASASKHLQGTDGKLEKFRAQRSSARHLAAALGEDAKDAFRQALLQGMHQPRCAKLGFVGAARAGKTSTLRALGGLPLRSDEESTPGLALWALSQELLSASPTRRWHLQDQRASASTSRWDHDVARFVADSVRPCGVLDKPMNGSSSSSSTAPAQKTSNGVLDTSVMKRMPVDLIARRLSQAPGSRAEEEQTIVLEAYDFGGQEVYYSMHHLFLTDFGIYLACLDLTSVGTTTADIADGDLQGSDQLASDAGFSTQTWEALEWWLASIAVHAPHSPVAIVGTHDDCLEPSLRSMVHRKVHERVAAFCRRLPELNEQLQVNELGQLCFFPIDNSNSDGGQSVARLRAAVEMMTNKLLSGALCKPIPLRWSHFWAVLQRASASNTASTGAICRIDELWRRAVRYGFESQNELLSFLQHFRGLGSLLHFPDASCEELRDVVCLNPALVAEGAAAILTAKDRVFQGCLRYVTELKEKGLLHTELLSAIWKSRVFARHQRQLVGLLQALDLLLAWGHDRQIQLATPREQHVKEVQKLYLVPSLLPSRPQRQPGDARTDQHEEDAVVIYLDFHGLLNRLLPTLMPRLLCTLSRMESGVQVLSVYANYALFAMSTQGQAKGDSARSLGSRRAPLPMLLVSLQPCAGEQLRCCIRLRRSSSGAAVCGDSARPSWKHVERLLHGFREAIAAWMPRISFSAGIRCPCCRAGRAHALDLHAILRDELTLCPLSGDLVEELPVWVTAWRQHHLQRALLASPHISPSPSGSDEEPEDKDGAIIQARGESSFHVHYLYASPLDVSPLDVRAELEALAATPGLSSISVRTGTTETLAEVWRTKPVSSAPRLLCLAAHCAVEPTTAGQPQQPSLLLEDAVGRVHVLGAQDVDDLLALNGPEVAAGGKSCGSFVPFDVVILDACHSEQLATRFVASGGTCCAVACTGEVFDAAAREFLRAFLRVMAASCTQLTPKSCAPGDRELVTAAAHAAFLAAQRAVRLSPQPGLRSEADRFKFILPPSKHVEHLSTMQPERPALWRPPPTCRASFAEPCGGSLPAPVEDFVGRGAAMTSIAKTFLGNRRVMWLHGRAGVGKSALAAEFCRFYALPGDRLFSPCSNASEGLSELPSEAEIAAGSHRISCAAAAWGRECSSRLLQLSGFSPQETLEKLQVMFGPGLDRLHKLDLSARRLWLLALDGVDNIFTTDDASETSNKIWSLLEDALNAARNLRILLTSRRPCYDAPLSCKVVAFELPPLAVEDVCLLLLRRAHRPLFPRDFDSSASEVAGVNAVSGGDPLALSGRRKEFLQRLSRHPLLDRVGGIPADVLSAAAKISPQLPSLFMHPLLASSEDPAETSS
eukprot:TRINITY_DN28132_c0_g1_i1.p1 TRINITY_DN28132_c0_g1~~TRINITY_DN28132_c0_g1_i1.p1  ORF type:complete len:1666 (-),score=253.03 TRINITY_DN28132_c0_g1_i1:85-5082(-)